LRNIICGSWTPIGCFPAGIGEKAQTTNLKVKRKHVNSVRQRMGIASNHAGVLCFDDDGVAVAAGVLFGWMVYVYAL
jgi:hypothetical protein